jgi:hypothetical protein
MASTRGKPQIFTDLEGNNPRSSAQICGSEDIFRFSGFIL